MSACDDKLLLLQAHVDGEIDAASTLSLETHLRTCGGCAEELARLDALRLLIVEANPRLVAPAALRDRIEAELSGQSRAASPTRRPTAAGSIPTGAQRSGQGAFRGPPRMRWASGGFAAGIAASLALLLAVPQLTRPNTEDALIANHIRSLSIGSHLTDVATSDRHVVKPWFNGKIDYAPPVPELVRQGFPLVGGRLDYIGGHQVAAIVYRRRLHVINVFVQPAGTLSLPVGIATKHDGYSIVRWTKDGLEFWAVSDIDVAELESFHGVFAGHPSL